MIVNDFIDKFVEGYILGDLETMSHMTLESGKEYGAVGYPMLMTTVAGMELLGGLLLPATDTLHLDAGHSRSNFLNYWNNYFCSEFPQYKGLGGLFYSLIRNGIDHSFITKHGIVVNKYAGPAILINESQKELYVNPNELYTAFKQSYVNLAKPIFDGEHASLTTVFIQARVDLIDSTYQREALRIFNGLPAMDPTIVTTDYWKDIGWPLQSTRLVTPSGIALTPASGPSGAMGPGNTTTMQTTVSFPQFIPIDTEHPTVS